MEVRDEVRLRLSAHCAVRVQGGSSRLSVLLWPFPCQGRLREAEPPCSSSQWLSLRVALSFPAVSRCPVKMTGGCVHIQRPMPPSCLFSLNSHFWSVGSVSSLLMQFRHRAGRSGDH